MSSPDEVRTRPPRAFAAGFGSSLEPLSPGHYARIGRRRGVRRLVEAFYRRVDADPAAAEIREMHADLEAARERLELFFVEWFGGPKAYSKQRGTRSLRARHFWFRVGRAERDAWLRCMLAALAETVPDAEFRSELEAQFARAAQAMVNRDN